LGARLLLSRNFRLDSAERAEKIPIRAENARLSGSQVYTYMRSAAVAERHTPPRTRLGLG